MNMNIVILMERVDKMREFDIEKITSDIDFEGNMLKRYGNLLLQNNEIKVLERYNIDYKNCHNMNELIFSIEEYLNDNYDGLEDLEEVSINISERNYYMNTNK